MQNKTAVDVKKESDQLALAVQEIIKEMKIRQWCIEKAVELSKSNPLPQSVKSVAQDIYDFVKGENNV